MPKVIAIIGGILAILGAVLSIFLQQLGWGTWTLITNPIIGSTTTETAWFNGFFGGITEFEGDVVNYSDSLLYLVGGIFVCLGGVLCLLGNKYTSIMGGTLILAGSAVWLFGFVELINLYITQINVVLDFFNQDLLEEANLIQVFSGSRQWDLTLYSSTFSWATGIGFYLSAAGGIIGLVGAFVGSDK